MHVLTTAEMQRVEISANEIGLEPLRLMENAGSAAARVIREQYAMAGTSVAVLCGSGNNGGDGFVIARKLLEQNAKVSIILPGDMPHSSHSMKMAERLRELPIPVYHWQRDPNAIIAVLQSAQLVVDAVFGIGFKKILPDGMRGLFRWINDRRLPVIAIDIPSGMHADEGRCDPDTLRAIHTITFTAMKPALAMAQNAPICGKLHVVDIGIPTNLWQAYAFTPTTIEKRMVQACFVPRPADSHKGSFGNALAFCGSYGMAGAATLAVKGALRCGAGRVTAAIPQSIYPMVTVAQPEAVCLPLPENAKGQATLSARSVLREALPKASSLLIGCGLGQSQDTAALVADLLDLAECPVVLDADGINAMATHIDGWKADKAPIILTPHPGEMARLCHTTVEKVEADRVGIARKLATEKGVWVVLKGHHTVIASPDREVLVNNTGNPGMATAGSGDVLAGMIASFAAQGMSPLQAAMCGVYLHGLAGDAAASRLSQRGMLPSDLVNELPSLLLSIENRR